MTKEKSIQKVKFSGKPKQTYNIGRDSFPHNVWKPVTSIQLEHITGNKNIRILFDFNPPINFSLLSERAEVKVVKKSKKRKKEVN